MTEKQIAELRRSRDHHRDKYYKVLSSRKKIAAGLNYWRERAMAAESLASVVEVIEARSAPEHVVREVRGFFESLTSEQKRLALSYDGQENHGDPALLRKPLRKSDEPISSVME